MIKKSILQKPVTLFLISAYLLLQTYIPAFAAAVPDKEPPGAPSGLMAVNVTCTSITLNWLPGTDNVGVKGYQVYRDGKKIITTTKNSYTNVELIPGRKYTYTVRAYDACGNVSGDSDAISVSAKSDIQDPSVPSGLAVFSVAYTTIALTWNPSYDNTSIRGYEVFCNGRKVSTTSSSYYECKGLTPGTAYFFSVKALDIAGNYSVQSNNIYASTVTDNTPPTVPTGLVISSVSETEINLIWSSSSDNVKVKGYDIFMDGIKIGTTSKTSYLSEGLIPGKTYSFAVRAIDSSGNISNCTSTLNTSTAKDLEAPSMPLSLKAVSNNGSSVALTWKASSDNIKVKGYYIYCNGFNIATTAKTNYTVKKTSGLGIDIYSVKAFDLADNLSRSSNYVTLLTF